jgi:hypothetical protein
MNSDTLDLEGERRGPTRRGRGRGHRCGRRVPPTAGMQGEGDGQGQALRTASTAAAALPSPITVREKGAIVTSCVRRRPPPPLPSRFFLSHAKWRDTLRRFPPPQPLPSPTRPRVRNTPRAVLEANQVRRFRRRKRYPSSRPLPRFGFLAPGGDHRWGTSTRLRRLASRTADPADPCEDAAAVALCQPARRLRGLVQREVIDSAINLR